MNQDNDTTRGEEVMSNLIFGSGYNRRDWAIEETEFKVFDPKERGNNEAPDESHTTKALQARKEEPVNEADMDSLLELKVSASQASNEKLSLIHI